MSVYGYVRVSTEEQGRSGLGLEAQRAAIREEASRRGWYVEFRQEVKSGSRAENRPVLCKIRDQLRRGDTLVVSKLDRLARSAGDSERILEEAQRRGWNLIALDVGIDLSTPQGELAAGIFAVVGRWERRIIGQRVSAALRVKVAAGWKPPQHQPKIPADVRELIRRLHDAGLSERAITARLNTGGVPSVGKHWYRTTVRRVLEAA